MVLPSLLGPAAQVKSETVTPSFMRPPSVGCPIPPSSDKGDWEAVPARECVKGRGSGALLQVCAKPHDQLVDGVHVRHNVEDRHAESGAAHQDLHPAVCPEGEAVGHGAELEAAAPVSADRLIDGRYLLEKQRLQASAPGD